MNRAVKSYFLIFFFLVVFGMVMVFNIRLFKVDSVSGAFSKCLTGLIVNFVIALAGFLLAYVVNLDLLKSWIKYLLPFMLLLLLATLFFGAEINGSKRWIDLHFMLFQPSEFAKIIAVLYLSCVICGKGEKIGIFKELVYPFFVIFILVILIAIEDLGSGLIIFATSIVMLLMAGMRWKYFGVLILLGAVGIAALILMPGKDYRIKRITTFIDPWEDAAVYGYQQVQSEIALGIGGLAGVGFGNSVRKIKHIPEPHTDFIFSVIGEEFGFLGASFLIILFLIMFLLGSYFALTVHNRYCFYLISGFVFLLACQTIINVGVVTSCLPNKGVPLPFISYGGSALLAYSIMAGLILNAVTSDKRF